MRGLTENDPAALRRIQFLESTRSAHEIRVVDGRDHPHRTELTAVDKLSRAGDWRIE
jgi:hypothetical protein